MSLLIGTVSPSSKIGPTGDLVLMHRFQAVASGNVTQIKIKVGVTGTVKVAIYADSSGEPGALLNAVNTATSVTADTEASITIASTAVSSGTYYWLSVAVASGQYYYYTSSSAGTRRYKAITYSGYSFPNPAGSGYSNDNYDCYVAGESEPAITSGDNGSATESASLLEKEIFSVEAGNGVDTGGIVVNKVSGDSGGGNEAGGLQKSLVSDDAGRGFDTLGMAAQKAGSDLSLYNTRGEVGIPHKEVSL